jgi:hypothetical protein
MVVVLGAVVPSLVVFMQDRQGSNGDIEWELDTNLTWNLNSKIEMKIQPPFEAGGIVRRNKTYWTWYSIQTIAINEEVNSNPLYISFKCHPAQGPYSHHNVAHI